LFTVALKFYAFSLCFLWYIPEFFLINKIPILLKNLCLSACLCGVLLWLLPALVHADQPILNTAQGLALNTAQGLALNTAQGLALNTAQGPALSVAEGFGVVVKNARITLQGDNYVLSADIDFRLSARAKEALQNGVPLYWDIHIKTLQHRDFFWDKTLSNSGIRYRIQYHALLNMYRVRNEGSHDVYNFPTLSSALDQMATIRGFRVLDKALYLSGKRYSVGVKVTLDRDALPLPLRPVAYANPQWYLSSDWTLWPLTK
jgi:hypothetical protein